MLGAGYVSGPVVDYLTRDESIGVTVAAALKEEAQKLGCNSIDMQNFGSNLGQVEGQVQY